MDDIPIVLFPEGDLEGVGSVEAGGEVRITYRGVAVLGFSREDPVGRDIVVASLLRAGMKGKSVARLCGVSEAHVTGVRKRVRAGGIDALRVRGKPGTGPVLTGRKLQRASQMFEAGHSYAAIARAVDVSRPTVRKALQRLGLRRPAGEQQVLQGVGGGEAPARSTAQARPAAEAIAERGEEKDEELAPGAALPVSDVEHPSRYAGTLLIAAAMMELGVPEAMTAARAQRRPTAVYSAEQIALTLMCGWVAGYGSLESMHERDARSLGVVLGLERSPSVRTLHRAIDQITSVYDPIRLGTELMRGLWRASGSEPLLFGVDGHFKAYAGKAPIDKGWDTKRRMAVRGLGNVMVHDASGMTWLNEQVPAGSSLSEHVVRAARRLREVHGYGTEPIVLCFDRGGFAFEVLNALDRQGFGYLAWVPATAKTPALVEVGPRVDGVGEVGWKHGSLEHGARLLVERDGDALLPAVTNLPASVDAAEAMAMLRRARGVEENSIKAARAATHIDRLSDRGGHRTAPDDRPVDNPKRAELRRRKRTAARRLGELERERPVRGRRTATAIESDKVLVNLEEALVEHQLRTAPSKVPRSALEPDALRAWLKTRNRALLLPLKLAADNSRRWLLAALGHSLAPTDHDYDQDALPRTLMALLRAPGTVRFEAARVVVTLELPLPPTAHERLATALRSLDARRLRSFGDPRQLVFRLAPRPVRRTLPHARAAEGSR